MKLVAIHEELSKQDQEFKRRMNAKLARKLERIMLSPLYKEYVENHPDFSAQLIDACVKARTWSKLPKRLRTFFEECEKSIPPAEIPSLIKPILNRDRYPHVDFLPDEDFRKVGDTAGTPLILLGFEQGTHDPIVARGDGSEYFAFALSELLSHAQDRVTITEDLR